MPGDANEHVGIANQWQAFDAGDGKKSSRLASLGEIAVAMPMQHCKNTAQAEGSMGYTTTGGLMVLGICLGASQVAAGNGHPTTGLVHHKQENSALQYDCVLQGEILECEFAQTRVSRMETPSGSGKPKTRPKRVYFGGKGPSTQECNGYQQLISALKNGQAPNGLGQEKFEEGLAWFASVDGQDFQAVTSFFSEYCSRSSPKGVIRVVRPRHHQKPQACSVSTRRFSRQFKRLPESDIWVAEEAASGACGVTHQDRFVPAISGTGNSVWTYVARTTVNNKSGITHGNRKCTNFIAGEVKYDWRAHKIKLVCDTISFSLFQPHLSLP